MASLLTEPELMEWIKRRLGAPELRVPLAESKLQDAIDMAKHWFIAKKGTDKEITISIAPGTVEYDMPIDCDAVIDVTFDAAMFDIALAIQPNLLPGDQMPYSAFMGPAAGSGGLYSSLVQVIQYTEMAKNILSSDRKWLWMPHKHLLLLLPANGGTAIVQYKSNSVPAIELLFERDHDLIKRWALAQAKTDLGNIFSRYASWPTAQGQSVANGAALLAQAEAEFKMLEEEIIGSAFPMPWVVG